MFSYIGYNLTVWIHLSFLLFLDSILSKPLSLEKTVNLEEISYNPEVNETHFIYDGAEYDEKLYDWTIDGSGYPFYADTKSLPTILCPQHCTCIVETVVYCSRQGITAISSDYVETNGNQKTLSGHFPDMTESVHLGYNNLTILGPRVLKNLAKLRSNTVSHLYLQNNKIHKINPDAFIDLPNLQTLDLSHNMLGRLTQPCEYKTLKEGLALSSDKHVSCDFISSEAVFLKSVSDTLTSLNLNNNSIKGIPNYSFLSLKNLEVLRISWNQITWISRKAFYGLHKLKVLQLRSNPLGIKTVSKMEDILQHFVEGEIFISHKEPQIPNIDSINFYPENDMNNAASKTHQRKKRDAEMFRGIEEIRTIQLLSLENLDLGETNLKSLPRNLPSSIKRLYLDNNYITKITKKMISSLERLEILQLGGNIINRIEDNVFRSLYRMQILDLSRNNITNLTSNSFHGLEQLWSLRLYGNRNLVVLPKKVFWSLPSLRLVYLHDCNLQTLPSGPWIFRLYALWLYGNPLDCRCGNVLSLLVRLYSPFSQKQSLKMDPYRSVMWDDADTWEHQRPEKSRCNLPGNFHGYKVEAVRIRDMRCSYQDAYDVEVARRVASIKFTSLDYQQDQSTTQNNQHHIVTREEDEIFLDDAKKTAQFDKFGIGNEKYSILNETSASESHLDLSERNDLTEYPNSAVDVEDMERIVEKEPKILSSDMVIGQNVADEEMTNTETTIHAHKKSYDNGEMDNTAEKIDTDTKNSEHYGTQWLISLAPGSELEGENTFELDNEFDQQEESESENQPEVPFSLKPKLNPKILPDIQSGDDELASIGVRPTDILSNVPDSEKSRKSMDVDYDIWGELGVNWNNYPQGFADHITYDPGNVEFDVNQTSSYREEIEKSLNKSDVLRFREDMKKHDGRKSYQDYYSDMESSGHDYEDRLFEYNFAEEVRRLSENGASLDDVIGNLTELYNISDIYSDYDYPSTTDITLLPSGEPFIGNGDL